MIITDEQIEQAKQHTMYMRYGNRRKPYHDHPDCIRLAVEWLAAQGRIKKPGTHRHGLKHYVESWAGRYVSADDVCVAGTLLGLQGRYPCFDISSRMTRPNLSRLEGIGEAMTHKNYLGRHNGVYSRLEAEV